MKKCIQDKIKHKRRNNQSSTVEAVLLGVNHATEPDIWVTLIVLSNGGSAVLGSDSSAPDCISSSAEQQLEKMHRKR